MKTQELIELTEKHSANNYAPVEIVLTKGEGAYVEDVEGKKYLDFLGGFSTLLFGHRPPRITKAAHEQLDRLTLTSRAFYNDELAHCSKEITELAGVDKVLFMNTGAEAVETAIKTARKWAHENRGVAEGEGVIITFTKNFHGRTISIVSGSDDPVARSGYGPFTPGYVTVPFGDIEAVKAAIKKHTVIGVLIEPIQGEAGVILPPESFLKELREVTEENDIVFIADEVQSGMGRTGKLFACDHYDIKPDLYAVGKVVGGGILPVSAVLGNEKFLGIFTPGTHGSTFGGSPLATSVTRAVIAEISAPNFLDNVTELGRVLKNSLETLLDTPGITAVRSLGLWAGVDIDPEVATAKEVSEALRKKGLLVKDTQGITLRMAPPAVATKDEIQKAIEMIREVVTEIS